VARSDPPSAGAGRGHRADLISRPPDQRCGSGGAPDQPVAMHSRPELDAAGLRAAFESTVGREISLSRLEEVVRSVRPHGIVGLLGVDARPRKVKVDEPGCDLVADDRLDGRPAHPELAARIPRRPDDRVGCDLGLEDRGDGLRLSGQLRPPPRELRSVQRRKVNRRDTDLAALVQELGAERVEETLHRVLGAAVGPLERDAAVGWRTRSPSRC
jgi:hypothetical protein